MLVIPNYHQPIKGKNIKLNFQEFLINKSSSIFFSLPESKCDDDNNETVMNRDQLVYEYFSKRFDELFLEKCKAESKVINFMTEVRLLNQNNNDVNYTCLMFLV